MTACFLRYRKKESPAQRPLAFITLKGMPRSRYSRVEPMRIPWPCSGYKPAACAAFPTRSRNLVLVRGLWVFLARYAKWWAESAGWLISR